MNIVNSNLKEKIKRKQVQELAKKCLMNDDQQKEFVEGINDNDTTVRGKMKKINLEEKQKYRKAIEALAEGEFNTMNKAAKKFGVHRRTLNMLLSKGVNYKGKGRSSRFLSYEEERILVQKNTQEI